MSFPQCFQAEVSRLAPLFAAAEEADKAFHQSWENGKKKHRSQRQKQSDLHDRMLDRFRQTTRTIDRIVADAFTEAKKGDHSKLPSLFAYLALPGRYFRSGYQRADIWRFVKKLPLDEEQRNILCRIILSQIETAGPEFVEMTRAVRRISTIPFRKELNHLLECTSKDYMILRIRRILSILESGLP